MPTVLITGCDSGIGLEFARQYAAAGWRVHAACLDATRAREAVAIRGDLSVHKLDVRSGADMADLSARIDGAPIDVLLSNAGIGRDLRRFGETDYDYWRDMLDTNTLGFMRLAETFADNVAASALRRIVAISSRMGSIGSNLTGGAYGYRSSKAALNAVVRSMALDLAPRGITVLALHPGSVRVPGDAGTVEPADSVEGMRAVIARCGIHETGSFYTFKDSLLPW